MSNVSANIILLVTKIKNRSISHRRNLTYPKLQERWLVKLNLPTIRCSLTANPSLNYCCEVFVTKKFPLKIQSVKVVVNGITYIEERTC